MPPTNTQTQELLIEMGRLLSSKLELSELLTSVLELSTRVVDSESASLLLLDEKTQELYFDVALGLGADAAKVRLKLGQGIAGTVAQNRKAEIINEVRKDPRWSSAMDEQSGFTTSSILAVPMLLKGRVIGVLEAINKRGGVFSEQDQNAFEAFASQAAIAVENARLFASLKEERFKLATVFSQMTNAVVLTDGAGDILLSNEAAIVLFGAELTNIGPALKPLTLTPPLYELLADDNPAADFVALRSEPTLLVLEGRATSVALSGRKGRLFIFHDRTENRRQETLKRTFLSLISHKLRTPLAAVTGFADLLAEDIDPQKDPQAARAVRAIREQGARVSELVDKLLSYTTIETPDIRIDFQPVAVDLAIKDALHSLEASLAARGAKTDFAPSGATVMGDKRMITEALKNLIDNAVKFNPATSPPATIRVESMGDWTTVSVADLGPGVPPEDIERVFSGFHQIEKDFTGQKEGLGLGLAYVKKVAALHGGSVVMRSKLGEGTLVTLTLPNRKPS